MTNERRLEHRILQILLGVLGAAAISIGLMVFVLGEQALNVVATVFDAMRGQAFTVEQAISPTVDSELRFYAVFWFGYGVLLLWVAREIVQRIQHVPIMAALFFAGGVGRVLSHVFVGAPHPIFTVLMAIEIIFPILLATLYLRLRVMTV